MQNIPPHTWVLHCPPWTLSVSVKLIKLHENSWKGKELDHIEYLYKPLLNINTCNRQVMMSQKLNWLNYGIGWHIQVFLPFIWANWLVHSLGKWYVRFRTGNWISTPNRIYYLYKSLPFTERSETGIKDGSGLPFQMLRSSRKFSAGTTQEVPFPLHYNQIFRKLL